MKVVRSIDARHRAHDQGSILIEAAVIIPIVIAIIAGILDFGYVYQQGAVIYQASRAGARTAGAQTADKTGAVITYWCTANAAAPTAWASCDGILSGNFPPLPHGGDPIDLPLQSGLFMSCHYLAAAGLTPADWETSITAPIRGVEDTYQSTWIKLTVRRRTSAKKCLLCLQQQFEGLILLETSTFPVQCRT